MKENLVQQVKIALQEWLKTEQQNALSVYDLGLSLNDTEISTLFGDPQKLSEEQLKQVIQTLKPQKRKVVTVGTANHETIQKANKETQHKRRLICILGEPGWGKTLGHDYYWRNIPNTIKVEATSSMRRKEFLAEILSQLNINFEGTIYQMLTKIAYEFKLMDFPLLIIDEISKLHYNSLMDLHDLRNRTMDTLGIVLSGCKYFKTNIEKEKNRQKQGIPEFYSRVQGWFTLEPPTKAEMAAICKANGITDQPTIKEFQRLQNFRELTNAILNETDKSES